MLLVNLEWTSTQMGLRRKLPRNGDIKSVSFESLMTNRSGGGGCKVKGSESKGTRSFQNTQHKKKQG